MSRSGKNWRGVEDFGKFFKNRRAKKQNFRLLGTPLGESNLIINPLAGDIREGRNDFSENLLIFLWNDCIVRLNKIVI